MYNYYAVEIQSNADGTGSLIPFGFERASSWRVKKLRASADPGTKKCN